MAVLLAILDISGAEIELIFDAQILADEVHQMSDTIQIFV
jgi:hypothetical protein